MYIVISDGILMTSDQVHALAARNYFRRRRLICVIPFQDFVRRFYVFIVYQKC